MSLERLEAIPLFSGIPSEMRQTLAEKFSESSVPAGQVIFSEGEEGDALFFIAEGRVAIQKLIEDNKVGAIGKAIEDSAEYYKMQSFNQALLSMIARDAVTVEEALSYSPNPNDLKIRLQSEGIVGTLGPAPRPFGGGRP